MLSLTPPESAKVKLRPRQDGSASHIGLAHVAFDYFHGPRFCDMPISWLDHKPHAIAVYASWPALPSAHATLATGRPAAALPGPVLHRLDCTSFRWRLRKVGLGSQRIIAAVIAAPAELLED